ncbi:MAG: hypothetical protein A2142_00470 [candidate division Zixibacteria bacterium RBG_16_48_11]|nr:MAG: hypothetical protein A2142_00470 [candidate division Zixibacteria bacterium RBG_16_48_11]
MLKKAKPKTDKQIQAVVYVSLKEGVLDPQGITVKRALDDLGYRGVKDVRSGRFFQITLEGNSSRNSQTLMAEIANKLLANPVIERFEVKAAK